jgi:hypothetical protein
MLYTEMFLIKVAGLNWIHILCDGFFFFEGRGDFEKGEFVLRKKQGL